VRDKIKQKIRNRLRTGIQITAQMGSTHELKLVWKTIQRDLPVLAKQVEGLATEVAGDLNDNQRS
jgi:uncharacterized protein with HEPN domain